MSEGQCVENAICPYLHLPCQWFGEEINECVWPDSHDNADCPYSPREKCCLNCEENHIACMIRDTLDGYIDTMFRTDNPEEPTPRDRIGRLSGPIEFDDDYLQAVAQMLPDSWSCSLWHKVRETPPSSEAKR
jgi:hypothetical protein